LSSDAQAESHRLEVANVPTETIEDAQADEVERASSKEMEWFPDLQPPQDDVVPARYLDDVAKDPALYWGFGEGRPTGTQSPRHQYRDAVIHSPWKARFRRVLERHNAPEGSGSMGPIFLDDHYEQIHGFIYSRGPKEQDLRLAWLSLDPMERNRFWPELMITTMDRFPESVRTVLSATCIEPCPAWYMVADTLKFVAKVALRNGPGVPDELFELINRLCDTAGSTKTMLPPSMIWHVLKKSTFGQGLQWMESLDARFLRIHPLSLLMFAAFFGSRGKFEIALKLLRRAKDNGMSSNSQTFRNVGNKILRASMLSPGGYHANSDILKELMEIGVPIKLDTYNALMLNAVEARDLQAALQIHKLVMAHKLKPDHIHWTIFLQGIKLSDDATLVGSAIDAASEAARTNDIIADQIIHLTALYHYRNHNGYAFRKVLSMYLHFFKPDALLRLGLLLPFDLSTLPQHSHQRHPGHVAIHIMLHCYMHHSRYHRRHHYYQIYLTYRRLVESGDPLITPCASHSQFSNTFMHVFGAFPDSLSYCPRILRDMAAKLPNPTVPSVRDPQKLVTFQQAPPDDYTWSILLFAFMRNKQHAAAMKVSQFMQKRRVKRSAAVWNTMVSVWAYEQDVERAVGALGLMAADGFAMSEWTIKGFNRVRNQGALMKALEKTNAGTGGAGAEGEGVACREGAGEGEHALPTHAWEMRHVQLQREPVEDVGKGARRESMHDALIDYEQQLRHSADDGRKREKARRKEEREELEHLPDDAFAWGG